LRSSITSPISRSRVWNLVAQPEQDLPGGVADPERGEPLPHREPVDDGEGGDVGVGDAEAPPGPAEAALAEPRPRVELREEGGHAATRWETDQAKAIATS